MLERDRAHKILQSPSSRTAVIDAHTHSGTDNYNILTGRYPSSQSVADLVSKLKVLGLDYAVNFVAPGSHFYFDFREIARSGSYLPLPAEGYPYQASNRQMLYETELFGEERIFPFFTIFPGYEEGAQAEEIERLAKANVIFGLKLHTLATRSKATDLEGSPFIEVAQEYSLPLLIHSRDDEYSDPNNIVELAKVYPDLRFCVAHAAMFNERIFEIARAQGNLFIDVVPLLTLCNIASGKIAEGRAQGLLELPYEDPLAVLRQLANRFPELILWGTDEPWTTVTNDQTKGVHLKSSYKAEVSILDLLPEDARRNISNVNTIKFLFGS